jgi:hypothetical protein
MTDYVIQQPLFSANTLYQHLYVDFLTKEDVANLYNTSVTTIQEYIDRYSTLYPPYDLVNPMYAYMHANSAYTYGNVTFTYSNSAFAKANAAYNQANGAFAQANITYNVVTGNTDITLGHRIRMNTAAPFPLVGRATFIDILPNSFTTVSVSPNGNHGSGSSYFAYSDGDMDNAAYIGIISTNTKTILRSSAIGSMTQRNLELETAGVTRAYIDASTGAFYTPGGIFVSGGPLANVSTSGMYLRSDRIGMVASAGAANNKHWDMLFNSSLFAIRILDDNNTTGFSALQVNRTDIVPSSVTLNNNKFVVLNDGRIYGTSLHNSANSVAGTTTQFIASGTYLPSITGLSNIQASTSRWCNWTRVGNNVTMSGTIDIDPTAAAAALTQFRLSLPIASNFTAASNAAGVGVFGPTISANPVSIEAVPATDDLIFSFLSGSTSNLGLYFNVQYEVA